MLYFLKTKFIFSKYCEPLKLFYVMLGLRCHLSRGLLVAVRFYVLVVTGASLYALYIFIVQLWTTFTLRGTIPYTMTVMYAVYYMCRLTFVIVIWILNYFCRSFDKLNAIESSIDVCSQIKSNISVVTVNVAGLALHVWVALCTSHVYLTSFICKRHDWHVLWMWGMVLALMFSTSRLLQCLLIVLLNYKSINKKIITKYRINYNDEALNERNCYSNLVQTLFMKTNTKQSNRTDEAEHWKLSLLMKWYSQNTQNSEKLKSIYRVELFALSLMAFMNITLNLNYYIYVKNNNWPLETLRLSVMVVSGVQDIVLLLLAILLSEGIHREAQQVQTNVMKLVQRGDLANGEWLARDEPSPALGLPLLFELLGTVAAYTLIMWQLNDEHI